MVGSPLAAMIRRLKPLCAALAVTDASFLVPGAHPMHRLFDALQSRAVGWQSNLNRVGNQFEEQVARAVKEARGWFEGSSTDLQGIFEQFAAEIERDEARASRMVQRVFFALFMVWTIGLAHAQEAIGLSLPISTIPRAVSGVVTSFVGSYASGLPTAGDASTSNVATRSSPATQQADAITRIRIAETMERIS